MACLALSLQPANGPDILLQTREWFPPARALVALSAFRQTRLSFSSKSQSPPADLSNNLGDDPLGASSGQVVVGVESKFLVVYRLVNSIYVLGITTADLDPTNNVFDCINTVNQAVSVVVATCRGVDVTPEKLSRKYPEVYMALDIVLRGVGAVRLAAILASIHGDSIAKMVHSGLDSEVRARGADTWSAASEAVAVERAATRAAFSSAAFELPPETIAAGDEFAASIAPADEPKGPEPLVEEDNPAEKDPFAASEAVNKPPEEALVEGFKKSKESAIVVADPTAALAGLEVTTLPPAAAIKPTFIGVEGFEGDYGGIEYGNEEATLSETFEGFDDAFGGGLDPSEFVATSKKLPKIQGLGGLELLATGDSGPAAAAATADKAGDSGTPLENLLVTKSAEMKGPEMYIAEEISAEFRESLLVRVGLQGVVYLRTLPVKKSEGKETEFSFRFVSTPGVKRVVMQGSRVSSLMNGMFHVRTVASDEAVPILKYSLQPRFTPIPLRVRLLQRHTGTLLSVMIQYASNPELPQPLSDVTFILKLPADPRLLMVKPKGILNREERELRWHVPDIPLNGTPGKLRARMPVDWDAEKGEEVEATGMVVFSVQGASTLSGVSLQPITDDKMDFFLANHRYTTKNYLCN